MELRKLSEDSKKVNFEYDKVPGCEGYLYYRDDVRVSRTFNPDDTTVTIGKPFTSADVVAVTFREVAKASWSALPAPTPAPSGSWQKGGLGLWSPGNSIPPSAAGLDMVISADWNTYQIKDFAPPTLSLVYQSPLSCDSRSDRFYGMSAQECIDKDWCLRDSSGKPVYSESYSASVLGDVGIPAYQDKWAANAIAFIKSRGMDGCQYDDVVAQLKGYASVAVPKYPTAQSWEDAMVSFFNNVGAKVKAAGLYGVANVYKSGGGDKTAAFVLRFKDGVNGAMYEFFASYADQISGAKTLLGAGVDVIGLDFTNSSTHKANLLACGKRALYMTG